MKTRSSTALITLALGAVLALLAGCATTTRIDAEWQDAEFAGKTLAGPVLVVGMTRDDTLRRLYEDAMVAQLHGESIQAIPSYASMPKALDGASSQRLLEAAHKAGAGSVLSSVLIDRESVQHVLVEPTPAWAWGDPDWYASYWPHAYVRDVRTLSRYVARTNLTDAATGKVVWSARTSTDQPGDVEKEIDVFARKIARALDKTGLV
jgi:hypothetical protein